MNLRHYMNLVAKFLLRESDNQPFLVPAIRSLSSGKIFAGERGDDHWQVAQRVGLSGVDWRDNPDIETGFVNHKNQFINRVRALDYAQEHDLLHDKAKRYLSGEDAPGELGASFLKKET